MSSPASDQFSIVDRRRRELVLGASSAALTTLAGCGGGGGGKSSPQVVDPAVAPIVAPPSRPDPGGPLLPIVPLDEGTLGPDGIRRFHLVVQAGTTQFRSGVSTTTLGYNGGFLGPALRLRAGERTSIHVVNKLAEASTVHWHGLFLQAEADGGPHQAIAPGAEWSADFIVDNPASTCWFHPHTHGETGRQVVTGLAGLLIVDDPTSPPAGLPETWGVDDIAIILQDKRFDANGQIDYVLTSSEELTGYMGDTLLVNGAVAPVWQAPAQWVRLRLLNGCNARTLEIRSSTTMPMVQIANEGGLLQTPAVRAAVTLAPGERAEILLDLSAATIGQEFSLLARTVSAGMAASVVTTDWTAVRTVITWPRQAKAIASVPSTLPARPSVVPPPSPTVRRFRLDGGMMGSLFTINGRSFDIGRIDMTVPANAIEQWSFFNATNMSHPLHVHGVRMSLLSRDGKQPAAFERGLRDTFVVESMQTVTVAVQTAALASASPLMFHCHILEHEDAGMMGQFITE